MLILRLSLGQVWGPSSLWDWSRFSCSRAPHSSNIVILLGVTKGNPVVDLELSERIIVVSQAAWAGLRLPSEEPECISWETDVCNILFTLLPPSASPQCLKWALFAWYYFSGKGLWVTSTAQPWIVRTDRDDRAQRAPCTRIQQLSPEMADIFFYDPKVLSLQKAERTSGSSYEAKNIACKWRDLNINDIIQKTSASR